MQYWFAHSNAHGDIDLLTTDLIYWCAKSCDLVKYDFILSNITSNIKKQRGISLIQFLWPECNY